MVGGVRRQVCGACPVPQAFVCMTLIWSTASFSRSVANYTLTLNNCKVHRVWTEGQGPGNQGWGCGEMGTGSCRFGICLVMIGPSGEKGVQVRMKRRV